MTTDADADALRRLAHGLQGRTGRLFSVTDDCVDGPGTTRVVIAPHGDMPASDQAAHIDVGFMLNRDRADTTIWDCATGFGRSKAEAIDSAVNAWLSTTGSVVLEFLEGTGEHADHYTSAETGLAGCHAIHGPILGWGVGDGPKALQQWWLDHPLLPLLAQVLPLGGSDFIRALRVFFGSQGFESIAEVTLDRQPSAAASDLLLAQDWPRFDEPAYVRTFVLVIPETL
ncbi:MAG TPA: DUF6348 family protein [Mycobacteriales bacterium]|jgi:hypothetical protein|nr:DUF6348 family protein [Mycobacteriales bacterium]